MESVEFIEMKDGSKEDYLLLDKVFQKLVEKDPNLYQAQIWLAKTLIIKKKYNSFYLFLMLHFVIMNQHECSHLLLF